MRNAFVASAAHLRDNHADDHDDNNNAEGYPEVPCGLKPQEHVAHEGVKRCSDSGHSLRIVAWSTDSGTQSKGRLG